MSKPTSVVPPQPCQICGKKMLSADELREETFTGVCDPCTGREPNVIGIEMIDGARLWAYPPARGSGSRQRKILVGYPDCTGCSGKGCQACIDRRNSHAVRKWIAAREARIERAVQAVYDERLRLEGILELARANRAPEKKLQNAVLPLMERVNQVKERWHNIVRVRLRFTATGV